jgi:uncharacterized protein CbrC (UPF0167 family)
MGRVFRYIADAALKPLTGHGRTCQVCDARGVDVYNAHGNILLPGGKEGEDCYAACAACLRAGRVIHIGESETDRSIRAYVRKYLRDGSAAKRKRLEDTLRDALRRTPRIPLFVQGDDWPLCCGDLTEFTGSPRGLRALIRLSKSAVYWEKRPLEDHDYDFEEDGPPEDWSDVSAFRCLHCDKQYWVFQFT